jgi:protein-S-isoprenylcysteine O-methyltransferase Ste14
MKNLKTLSITLSSLLTIVSIIISLFSRLEYKQFHLWKSVDIIVFNWGINLSIFFIVHLIIGALILFISFYQCIEIVKINNQVHKAKNQPIEILDWGFYAKVRHPMATRFILIVLGFFFMFSSMIGIPLILFFIIFFIIISLYEEKKILYPIFGEKYREYTKEVNNRFFTKKMKIIVVSLFVFMIIGALFI